MVKPESSSSAGVGKFGFLTIPGCSSGLGVFNKGGVGVAFDELLSDLFCSRFGVGFFWAYVGPEFTDLRSGVSFFAGEFLPVISDGEAAKGFFDYAGGSGDLATGFASGAFAAGFATGGAGFGSGVLAAGLASGAFAAGFAAGTAFGSGDTEAGFAITGALAAGFGSGALAAGFGSGVLAAGFGSGTLAAGLAFGFETALY